MSVFEHQRLRVDDFAQASDFAWLMAQELAVFTLKRQRRQWQLNVGHYIGIVMLPSGITLEILPKPIASAQIDNAVPADSLRQTRQWLQGMLTDLTQQFKLNNGRVPHSKHFAQLSRHGYPLSSVAVPPLPQWLAQQFLPLLCAYPPAQHYQRHVSNQSTLHGKLLIKEQLRYNGAQPHKFISEVSTLSHETLGNRLIKSALLLLAPFAHNSAHNAPASPILSANLSANLSAWRHISSLSVQEKPHLDALYLSAKRQLASDPLPRSHQLAANNALDLAHWLLQAQHISTASSHLGFQESIASSPAPLRLCLLMNMNQAFEQWASTQIAITFEQRTPDNQPQYQASYQPRDAWLRDLSGQVCLSVQPDLLIYRIIEGINNSDSINSADDPHANSNTVTATRQCSHVIDIKWKHLSHTKSISASDAYQLSAYAQAYQAEQAWLVYPVTDNERQPVALQPLADSKGAHHATLWLMPFNVLTGKLNGDLP